MPLEYYQCNVLAAFNLNNNTFFYKEGYLINI